MKHEEVRVVIPSEPEEVEARIQKQGWGYECDNCGKKWVFSLALIGEKGKHGIQWDEDTPRPSCGFAVYYELEEDGSKGTKRKCEHCYLWLSSQKSYDKHLKEHEGRK